MNSIRSFLPVALAIGVCATLAAMGAPIVAYPLAIAGLLTVAVLITGGPRLAAFSFAGPVLAALFVLAAGGAALAADAAGNGVSFDLGAILSPLVQILGAVLLTVASWAVSFLPPIVKAMLTEQLLKRAVDYAVATVEGASAGKTVTIPVANEMIRVAAQYAADNGPKITKWLADSLGPKIIARLGDVVTLPAEANISNLDHDPKPVS